MGDELGQIRRAGIPFFSPWSSANTSGTLLPPHVNISQDQFAMSAVARLAGFQLADHGRRVELAARRRGPNGACWLYDEEIVAGSRQGIHRTGDFQSLDLVGPGLCGFERNRWEIRGLGGGWVVRQN